MCVPEVIPSSEAGRGFERAETYVGTASECGRDVCVVNRLDNHTNGELPADPTNLCAQEDPERGCVTPEDLESSVHCSCPCDGPGPRSSYCTCPDDFVCREILAGKMYCVRPR
jgi:hypothetical protein